MAANFRLPDVGGGIADAEIVKWHISVGDEVKEDQPMVEIQTDKALVEIPCPASGTVLRVLVGEGELLSVGDVLLTIGAPGDALEDDAPSSTTDHAGNGARDVETSEAAPTGKVLASPAARKLARDAGIDLASVDGTGPGGRVLSKDIAVPAPGGAEAVLSAPVGASAAPIDAVMPLRGARRVIAVNLSEAWRTIPHIFDFREADLTALIAVRRALVSEAEAEGDAALAESITPFALLAKIAAVVLRDHPAINGYVDMKREEIVHRENVDLNIAVAAPGGVLAPVIRAAEHLTIPQIAHEISRLATAARVQRLRPDELTTGTFTVSNYGSLGSPLGTTIIQLGQSASLGFGRAQEKPVVRNGYVVVRPMMAFSCAGDHRAMDGQELQAFVNQLVRVIENPMLLLSLPRPTPTPT